MSASAADYLARRVDPLAGPTDTPPLGRLGIRLGPTAASFSTSPRRPDIGSSWNCRRGVIYESSLIGFTGI